MPLPRKPSVSPSVPAFRVPKVVAAMLGLMVAIHALRQILSEDADIAVLSYLLFSPARYAPGGSDWPGGEAAAIWSFATYGLLHANLLHLAVNGFWLLAFGSAVAKRFGNLRFLLFSVCCAACGAGLYLALHWGDNSLLIGASAAISGHMAAAALFMFQGDNSYGAPGRQRDVILFAPASRLVDLAGNHRALGFIGVWLILNLLAGLAGFSGDQQIAWEAHLGGFLGGLSLFSWFDPIKSR